MHKEEFDYQNRHIVIEGEKGKSSVTIDGEAIPVWYDAESDSYIATRHSPFKAYPTLVELVKNVVEHVINQRSD